MTETEEKLIVLTDALAAAPAMSILWLFHDVRDNNFKTGRNTAKPGTVQPGSTVAPDVLALIAKGINQTVAFALIFIQQTATTLGTDVATAADWIRRALGF